MRDRNGKVWITAKQYGGVYIVSKITLCLDVPTSPYLSADSFSAISTSPYLSADKFGQREHLTSAFPASDALTPTSQNQASEAEEQSSSTKKDLYKL